MSIASIEAFAHARKVSRAEDVAALPFRSRIWMAPALMLADLAVLEACVGMAFLLRQSLLGWLPISLTPQNYVGVAAGLVVLPGVFWLLGLYPGYGISGPERLRRRTLAMTAIFATLIGWDYLVQGGVWSRGILLLTWAFAVIALPVANAVFVGAFVRAGCWGAPVLVVGPAADAAAMIRSLKAHPGNGLVPVGFFTTDPVGVLPPADGVPFLGAAADVNRFAGGAVGTLLVVRPSRLRGSLGDLVMSLDFPRVILVPSALGGQGLSVAACDLGRASGLEVKRNLLIPHNRAIKRTLDCALAVPLFVFSLPLLALLCVAVMLVSPGSPFFAQVREGRGGRPFRMLKLRTMYPGAERRLAEFLVKNPTIAQEWNNTFKLRKDPRILPIVGSFLRKSSLDELPQLLNVLRGDMSLVGPRPFPHYHLECFDGSFLNLRRSVMPGLTGLWQVEARSDSDLRIQEDLDTHYIRNWSLWLDLYILGRTFVAVLRGRGAR